MRRQGVPSTGWVIAHHFASLETETLELVYMCLLQPSHSNLFFIRVAFGDLGAFHNTTDFRTTRIDVRPKPSGIVEALLRCHIMLGDLGVLWVIRFRRTQKGLERDQGGFEGEDGGPSVLEDV